VKRDTKALTAVMDFNLAQLLKQPTGAAREYSLNEDLHGLDAAIDATEPLTGTMKLIRTKSGALLTLRGKTSLRVACSRCLDPVTAPVSLDFEEELLQTVDIITGVTLHARQDDPALLIDGHHEMHLADLIREYLLLALPMHPLCREDCKGLCPQCGHNLNNGPCACDSKADDERWAALKALLKQSGV
jgi:uncharacterized protein